MKLTVARKLYAGFVAVLVLLAMIAAVGTVRLNEAQARADEMYSGHLLGIEYALSTNVHMIASARVWLTGLSVAAIVACAGIAFWLSHAIATGVNAMKRAASDSNAAGRFTSHPRAIFTTSPAHGVSTASQSPDDFLTPRSGTGLPHPGGPPAS